VLFNLFYLFIIVSIDVYQLSTGSTGLGYMAGTGINFDVYPYLKVIV
jgi:hypothetical protein